MIMIPQGMSLAEFVSREVGRACSYSRLARRVYNRAADAYKLVKPGTRPVLREQINTARALDHAWNYQCQYELAYPLPGLSASTIDMRTLIEQHDCFVVDIFGTCKAEDERIWDEAAGALRTIVRQGKQLLIVSNTADFSVEQTAEQLQKVGVQVRPEQVITSGQILDQHFQKYTLVGRPILYLGNDETRKYVEQAGGVPVTELDGQFDAVVLSVLDKPLSAGELDGLKVKLREKDMPVFLPNSDMFLPRLSGTVENMALRLGRLLEDKGMTEVIEVGKPNSDIYERVFRQMAARSGSRVLCIGDTLWTDIQGAKAFQAKHPELVINSLLVFSGTERRVPHFKQMLLAYMDTIDTYPTFVLPSLKIAS